MIKKNSLLFVFLLFTNIIFAQDSNFVRKIICNLSADSMFGRGYSYNGDAIAADYICSLLTDMKVRPLQDSYRQHYGFFTFAMEGKVYFKLKNKELAPYDDYRIAPFSASLHDQFVIQKITPDFFNDPNYQIELSKRYGASLSNRILYLDISHKKWQKKENKETVKRIIERLNHNSSIGGYPAMLIGTETMPVWSFSGTGKKRDFALIYVRPTVLQRHLKDTVSISFQNKYKFHKTQNIYAFIEGREVADSFYVFTAHYDHLGTMGESVIFPGAHDNASGVAFLLDLVRHYQQHPPAYSLIFIFLSGEEAGLKGSFYAVNNPLFDFEKVKLLINLDMQCGGDDGIMVVNAEDEKTKKYYQKMVAYNQKYQLLPAVKSRPNAPNSDHYPFSAFMPAIFIYTLGGKIGTYHHYDDTCERCSLINYKTIFNLITKSIIE